MPITFNLRRRKRANDSAAQMWACCVAHHREGSELPMTSQLEGGWAGICLKATANTQRTSEVSEVWLLNGPTRMPWEVHESDEENYVN